MRFVCLRVAHLPTLVEDLLRSDASQQPTVILRAWDNRVLDASAAAEAAGVGPGDSLRRVEQLCPQALVLPAREALYQSYHTRLRSVLAGFSDVVESGELGEFYIESTVVARNFEAEKALVQRLVLETQAATGLAPSIGLAGNKFTAACAAQCEPGHAVVVPAGRERAFLAPLPLRVLPEPPPELLRRLHLFGITTLQGFAQLPRAAVARQFGAREVVFYDLARAIDTRPLIPDALPPMLVLQRELPEPLADRQVVLALLERLAGRLARRLGDAGYQAMAVSLNIRTVEGRDYATGAPLKPPTADPARLGRLLARLLGKLDLSAAVTTLRVTAYPLREWHLGTQQLTLLEEGSRQRWARLQAALRGLWQRFGEAMIRLASAVGPPLPLPIEVQARPDGAPLALRWGGWARLVDEVYEYWREERRWWDETLRRDYYQVVAEGETVYTVYRDEAQRWFLDRRRAA